VRGGGRAPAAHARGRPTSRQAPGTPAVRPQTFGDGATREPGKLSDFANSERFELFVALPLERQQAERQRSEETPDLVVAHDEQRLIRDDVLELGEHRRPARLGELRQQPAHCLDELLVGLR